MAQPKKIPFPQPSKKFARLHSKYKLAKVIYPHVIELNIPTGILSRFHVDLLKSAAGDPLLPQICDDEQPDPVEVQSMENINSFN